MNNEFVCDLVKRVDATLEAEFLPSYTDVLGSLIALRFYLENPDMDGVCKIKAIEQSTALLVAFGRGVQEYE